MKTVNMLQSHQDSSAVACAGKSKWKQLFLRRMRTRITQTSEREKKCCDDQI